jgi:membrane protein implicated in regulation of membrane protease activity
MAAWIFWLILAAVLGVAELLTVTLTLGLLAAAAAAAGVVGAFGAAMPFQILAFVLTGIAGLALVRPVAMRHLRQPPALRTGVAALVGKTALVVREVSALDGRVRIGGEEWSSRAYDETLVIPVGATVDVIKIEGATALVYPREQPWSSQRSLSPPSSPCWSSSRWSGRSVSCRRHARGTWSGWAATARLSIRG